MRRRAQLSPVMCKLLTALLDKGKTGAPDRAGVLKAVTERREFKSLVRAATKLDFTRSELAKDPVAQPCASDYIIAIRQGDRRLARQVLSLLVVQPQLSDSDVMNLCTEATTIKIGDHVRVLMCRGNA